VYRIDVVRTFFFFFFPVSSDRFKHECNPGTLARGIRFLFYENPTRVPFDRRVRENIEVTERHRRRCKVYADIFEYATFILVTERSLCEPKKKKKPFVFREIAAVSRESIEPEAVIIIIIIIAVVDALLIFANENVIRVQRQSIIILCSHTTENSGKKNLQHRRSKKLTT